MNCYAQHHNNTFLFLGIKNCHEKKKLTISKQLQVTFSSALSQ